MRVTVSARHVTVTDEMRDRAESILQRLSQLTPFAQEGTAVFDTESVRQTVELRLRLSGGQVLVAEGGADNHRTALDQAEQRMRRQMERPVAKSERSRRGTPQA